MRHAVAALWQSAWLSMRRGQPAILPDWILAGGLATVTFYDYFLNRIHGVVTPLALLLLVIWSNAVLQTHVDRRRAYELIALGATFQAFAVVFCRYYATISNGGAAAALQKLLVIAPASAAIGWMLIRSGRIRQYLSWYLLVAMLTVIPAIAERGLHRQLLRSGRSYARGGAVRALVGTPQPLVLATLFVAMIPLAFYLLGRWRYLGGLWLLAGVFMTGSNGPEGVGVLIFLICAVPFIPRYFMRTAVPLLVTLFVGGLVLVLGGLYWWSPQVRGSSTMDKSNGYREALYWLLPRLLNSHPAGYGLAGLPTNTWFFGTNVKIVDVSQSIDSEVVYGAAQFGYFAVAAFVGIAVLASVAIARHQSLGLSNLSLTLCGLFTAMHAWNSLSSLWFFGVGACAALLLGRQVGEPWEGLSHGKIAASSRPLADLIPATG
ncbi:hypothetical protein [uncultured Jatrophihabitans sp.]|uniref:hypothetical protein n=1 Tax=uncultured Jatrophihabitans sp. TaxID=1610747 RepID=UPI0035CB3E82